MQQKNCLDLLQQTPLIGAALVLIFAQQREAKPLSNTAK